jgi:hypothetical protein
MDSDTLDLFGERVTSIIGASDGVSGQPSLHPGA